MLRQCGGLILALVCAVSYVSSKGIVLYGNGKVVAGKRPTAASQDEQDVSDKFHFALFTPTAKIGRASGSFEKFTRQAVNATLSGYSRQRKYYFMEERKMYEISWMHNDSNVCESEVKARRLNPNGGFIFDDPEQGVTIYFLCDQYCCKYQCCDINVIFLVCMMLQRESWSWFIPETNAESALLVSGNNQTGAASVKSFIVILALAIITWLCCRFGYSRWRRGKENESDDPDEYEPPSQAQRTESIPLRGHNYDDDIRL